MIEHLEIAWILFVISTSIILTAPFKRNVPVVLLRRLLVATVVASVTLLFAYKTSTKILYKLQPSSEVTITALNERHEKAASSDIVIKGFVIDGKWLWANTVEHSDSGWDNYGAGAYYWKSFENSAEMKNSITFKLPAGISRTIVFESNKWHGKCSIVDKGIPVEILDTYSNSDSSDFGYSLSSISISQKWLKIRKFGSIFAAVIAFIFVQILFFIKRPSASSFNGKKRIVWMDALRIVCIFTVIFLHYTSGLFNSDSAANLTAWIPKLLVNSLTTFAVPCFFMLSGALILNKEESISHLLKKRIPSVYVPLLFWSVVYISYFGALQGSSAKAILKSIYSSQYYHLWFMYPLIGLYFLSPIIRKVFIQSEESLSRYAYAIMCIVPLALLTISRLFQNNYISAWFSWGFPETGLFVAGAWIARRAAKRKTSPAKLALSAIASFLSIAVCEQALILLTGKVQKNFIGAYGTIPVFAFALVVFALFVAFADFFEKLPDNVKSKIGNIAQLSMGIYFVHLLTKALLDKTGIYQSDSLSVAMMLFASIVNFIVSLAICQIFSQIPIVRNLFGKTNSKCCYTASYTNEQGGGKKYENGMVGMRVIATFLIAIYHWELYYKFLPDTHIFSCAFLCVEFFFVLSGFLFAKSILEKRTSQPFFTVVLSRFVRLWPAFIVGTLLLPCVYVATWFGGNYAAWFAESGHLRSFLAEIPMLQTTGIANLVYINGPAWYASALLVCSALLYFVLAHAKRFYAVFALFFSILFFSISFANTPTNFVFNVIPFPLVRGMAGMSLGILTYAVHTKLKDKIENLRPIVLSAVEVSSFLFMLKMMLVRKSDNLNLLVLVPIFILILFMFSENTGLLSVVLKNKRWAYFAEISYAFYIMQSFCSNIFTCFFPSIQQQPLVTILYLSFNFVVAVGVHEFFEKPITSGLIHIQNKISKKGAINA